MPVRSAEDDGEDEAQQSLQTTAKEALAGLAKAKEALEAEVVRRVREQTLTYRARAMKLRAVLDDLNADLGVDVRALGLKALVKQAIVQALDDADGGAALVSMPRAAARELVAPPGAMASDDQACEIRDSHGNLLLGGMTKGQSDKFMKLARAGDVEQLTQLLESGAIDLQPGIDYLNASDAGTPGFFPAPQ